MHIALLNSYALSNSHGGVERVFCHMANALVKAGHQVTALSFDPRPGIPVYPLDPAVHFENPAQQRGVPLGWINFSDKVRAILSFSSDRRTTRFYLATQRYARMIERTMASRPAVDLWIAFQAQTAYALQLLEVNQPVILMVHGYPAAETLLATVAHKLTRVSMAQVLLPAYAKAVEAMMPASTQIEVIGNVVPTYIKATDPTQKVIIASMRVVSEKRPHLLIEAMAHVHARYPEWRLQIWGPVGSSNYVRHLKARTQALHLEGVVQWMGSTDTIEAALSHGSIYVLPSGVEGFSLALTEAMAKGLAVIGCSDCAASSALIDEDQTGLLAAPTPEALSQALMRLIEDEALRARLGQKARIAMARFSEEKIGQAWLRAIQQVTSERSDS